jgi:predicted transcriptional regulator
LPNHSGGSTHVSLRVPNNLIQAFDRLAIALERPRSWVMVRALRQYLDEEGAEIVEDTESLAELDRGDVVTSEDLRRKVKEIIGGAEKTRTQEKWRHASSIPDERLRKSRK